jgi:HK97 family phage portal protein
MELNIFKTRATDPKALLERSKLKKKNLNQSLFMGLIGGVPIVYNDTPLSYIKDGYMLNPDVYAVVNIITRAAAAVPPLVLEVKDEKKAREYYRLKHSQRNGVQEGFQKKQRELREKAFEEVPETNDLYKLIQRPNPLQAFPEFLENFWGFWEVTGNAFAHGVELSDGRFSEMWVMPPQLTQINVDKGLESLIESYNLIWHGSQHKIPADTVLHVKYWNPDYSSPGSHLYGMSPLRSARAVTASGNDGLTALTASYRNMGASGMAFPDDKDVEQLTNEQREGLSREIQNASGPKNTKSVLVTSVKMGWQAFGLSPVDLEILQALNLSLRKICNIYGVSSELLNDPENKTQANKKESRKGLYMDNVIPKMERVYAELNRWLTPRFNKDGKRYHIDYDTSSIEALADDVAKKVEWLQKMWQLTPNQVLQEMDFDESDNPLMNEVWAPMGRMPIGESQSDLELRELVENYGVKLNGQHK